MIAAKSLIICQCVREKETPFGNVQRYSSYRVHRLEPFDYRIVDPALVPQHGHGRSVIVIGHLHISYQEYRQGGRFSLSDDRVLVK